MATARWAWLACRHLRTNFRPRVPQDSGRVVGPSEAWWREREDREREIGLEMAEEMRADCGEANWETGVWD